MACNCNEFSRSHLMRQAAAQAGNGLPAIEPGMPVPAGTGLSRRSFLLRSGATMLSVYGASKLGFSALQEGIAKAQGSAPKVLVSVFLDGGADSLSILAPVGSGKYNQLRPNLALSASEAPVAFSGIPSLRWHASAQPAGTGADGFQKLYDEGKLTVFPGIGYDDPDQSHFTSRHYWEVGALDPGGATGWMGRYLDLPGVGDSDNPLQGLSLDGSLSPALATATNPVAAIDGTSYDLWVHNVWDDEINQLMFDAARNIAQAGQGSSDTGFAKASRVQRQSIKLRADLEPFGEPDQSGYPDVYFGQNLAALASMLKAGLPIQCAALTAAGGYDTHDNQESSFGDDLGDTVQSLVAFQRDLEEVPALADRVLTLVWSEFGRRPEENSLGTDHGAGGTAFLMGTSARKAAIGEWPGLDTLDEDDNLRHTSDFRNLYASLLEDWFQVDASDVLPGVSSTRYALLG
jgi:uncharacterized protein (DUF1501 family)